MAKTTKRTTQTERTAAKEYAQRARVLGIKLNLIKDRMEERGRRFKKAGSTDWGYVWDLGDVIASLDNILGFISPGENNS